MMLVSELVDLASDNEVATQEETRFTNLGANSITSMTIYGMHAYPL